MAHLQIEKIAIQFHNIASQISNHSHFQSQINNEIINTLKKVINILPTYPPDGGDRVKYGVYPNNNNMEEY